MLGVEKKSLSEPRIIQIIIWWRSTTDHSLDEEVALWAIWKELPDGLHHGIAQTCTSSPWKLSEPVI